MPLPLILINFKTYEEATGDRAVELASKIKLAPGVEIAFAVQATDIRAVAKSNPLPVYAQHVDPVIYGSNTGSILPEAVKLAGAKGTLLNHAEKKLSMKELEETISRCKSLELKTVVCTESVSEAMKIKDFTPDYIAFEVPELIGTGQSVSKMRPENVREFANMMEGTSSIPLCGAGISTAEDVKISRELGTKGVLVSTGIVKDEDPGKTAKEMAQALA